MVSNYIVPQVECNFKFWKEIWDYKGGSNSEDLVYLGGYEDIGSIFDSDKIADSIKNLICFNKADSVLEVGCGAGVITKGFTDCSYTGVDYSESLAKKNKSMFGLKDIYISEADSLPFPNNYFDKTFSFGVFHYFPNLEYTEKVISEMVRVTRKLVLIGDLKFKSKSRRHYVYPKSNLGEMGFEFSECVYGLSSTYNALLVL